MLTPLGNNHSVSGVSTVRFADTFEAAPSTAPRNVSVSGIAARGVTVSFRAPAVANGYISEFLIRFQSEYESEPRVVVLTSQLTVAEQVADPEYVFQVPLTELHANARHNITVAASTLQGEGPASAPIEITTPPGIPQAPSAPSVDVTAEGVFVVTWEPPFPLPGTHTYTPSAAVFCRCVDTHCPSHLRVFPSDRATGVILSYEVVTGEGDVLYNGTELTFNTTESLIGVPLRLRAATAQGKLPQTPK